MPVDIQTLGPARFPGLMAVQKAVANGLVFNQTFNKTQADFHTSLSLSNKNGMGIKKKKQNKTDDIPNLLSP